MRGRSFIILFFLFLLFLDLAAQQGEQIIMFQAKDFVFSYNLMKPKRQVELPSKLREISGICVVDKDRIAAVQDEKGNIYIVNAKSGEITRKIDFADDGDYEGITLVGSDAWVLKSNGDLYRVKDFLNDELRKVKIFETDLSKKNDLEGITYDAKNNRLLIAGKGHPYIDNSGGKHKKAIYQFDLKDKKLKSTPIYIIDLDEIKYFKKYNTMTRMGIDILASLDESKGDVTFQSSGLAIHPLSGNIYVIGAVGDLLIVLHPNGEMLALVEMDDKLFNQAEGICFDVQGDLYISNEAGDKKATLLKFEPK